MDANTIGSPLYQGKQVIYNNENDVIVLIEKSEVPVFITKLGNPKLYKILAQLLCDAKVPHPKSGD
jgi:hypothetical protein